MQTHWIYRFISPKLCVLNVSVMLLGLSCLLPATSQAEMSDDGFAQMRQLAQLAEYIAVDYMEAVRDGQVVKKAVEHGFQLAGLRPVGRVPGGTSTHLLFALGVFLSHVLTFSRDVEGPAATRA